jgi:XTP/dITP diphosphohydrolase
MDKLRSPGGCPWDAEQDHKSLLKFLLEESYEFTEAIEDNDREAMLEELGDLLLQVYFHARIAEEDKDQPFNIDDVARTVTDKLVRRHPHVFSDTVVKNSSEVLENWERQKAVEKGRTSAIDGVPLGQPALALVTKLLYRVSKFDYKLDLDTSLNLPEKIDEDKLGALLMGLISQAVEKGVDPEAALRSAAKSLILQIQSQEAR